ncbi:hypothetical protein A9K71_10905 [Mesorhizobium sp. WSM3873]|nr:hypothetical protein A9K71_10905 [Mesorhizobium sp. WSM3873]
MRLFGTTMARTNLGRVRIADWIGKGGDYPTNEETAGHHHMGGTRMGTCRLGGHLRKVITV